MAPSSAMPKSTPAALSPALPDDADRPLCAVRLPEGGIVAAYSPAQLDRPEAWALLVELSGVALLDVTPASALAIAA